MCTEFKKSRTMRYQANIVAQFIYFAKSIRCVSSHIFILRLSRAGFALRRHCESRRDLSAI